MSMFELNSKIELLDEEGNRTFGLIHDYVDGKLYISTTSEERDLKIFHVDDQITGLTFSGPKGTSFDGIVSNRISGDLLIYEISNIDNYKTVQRREDVRVSCSMDIYYTDNVVSLRMDKSVLYDKIEDLKEISENAITTDLSAGGIKFSTKNSLDPYQEIIIIFYINKEPIIVKGKVLHKMINIVKKSTYYSYGVKFLDGTEIERETIIRYLFVLMRKNRIR
ncbi:MAG: PilZ domain-containing protein [Tissierellia bacterium]|nr:PilZ domain-containing protein [Tissierellia bacterium]MDD4726420.1 PilZ domain-containing protein [Tissierellia bacterium]